MITQFKIFEYNKNDLFLSNYETAKEYAYENIDDVADAFDSEEPYIIEKYENLIDLYVAKYNDLKNEDSVTIYRLVKLKSINELDINNIGKHWSFEKDGVGDYGNMGGTGKPFILEGEVNPKFIDWEYGFSSFIWYGEDQWECALEKGAKVIINSVDDVELQTPIISIVKSTTWN